MDESQLRRIIGELEQAGILKHIPGVGAGNHSSYIFCELEVRDSKGDKKGDEKGDKKADEKGDKKGDFFDPPIRKDKTFTNTKPPNPLSETKRDLRKLKAWIENDRNQFCEMHPNSGKTQWGTCWGCYAEQREPKPFFPIDPQELLCACKALCSIDADLGIADMVIYLNTIQRLPDERLRRSNPSQRQKAASLRILLRADSEGREACPVQGHV